MTRTVASIRNTLGNSWSVALCTVVAIAQSTIWIIQYTHVPAFVYQDKVLLMGIWFTGSVIVYAASKAMSESRRLKNSFSKIHDLNHLYRDTLAQTSAKLFLMEDRNLEMQKRALEVNNILAKTEIETIHRVVSIIAQQFQLLINSDAVVTFWKYDAESKTCIEQETSANGINASRPFRQRIYNVDKNSIFCENKYIRGRCWHFHNADLTVSTNGSNPYLDERPDHIFYYKSILCVPIQFAFIKENNQNVDRFGYLQVDSPSRNHLNDHEHLYLLSAYADQLYNFLSIVRKNFILA